jgi:hypothetical protein
MDGGAAGKRTARPVDPSGMAGGSRRGGSLIAAEASTAAGGGSTQARRLSTPESRGRGVWGWKRRWNSAGKRAPLLGVPSPRFRRHRPLLPWAPWRDVTATR